MADADDPLQGEVPVAALQLGIILGVQVEVLGQLLLGHVVQQAVFLDILRYGVRCVLFHSRMGGRNGNGEYRKCGLSGL